MKCLKVLATLLLVALPVAGLAQGVPISGLPSVQVPGAADLTVIVHNGVTSNASLANIFASAPAIAATSITATGFSASSSVCTNASSQLSTSGCTGGSITGVTAGTGLSGGGTSGNVTVSLAAFAGVAVGGALTTATTGNFSGTITDSANAAISLTSTTPGITGGGTIAFSFAGNNVASFTDTAVGVTEAIISRGGILAVGGPTDTATSALPPLYTQTGAQNTSAHSAFGSCTISTGTNPTCTVTFSGVAAPFTSATSYACAVSTNALVITSSLANADAANTSGTVTVVDVIGVVTTGGTATVVCTGT